MEIVFFSKKKEVADDLKIKILIENYLRRPFAGAAGKSITQRNPM